MKKIFSAALAATAIALVSPGAALADPALGYVSPKTMLEGRRDQVHAERDRKLEAARRRREELEPSE